MKQPQGFEVIGKENMVCLLRKSLYGLKQSPRQWNRRFDEYVIKLGLKRSKFDPCIYFREKNSNILYLLLYVDDILIASKSMQEIQHLKLQLKKEFEMKDMGAASRILGMDIIRDRGKRLLCLNQSSYIKKVLETFDMSNSKTVLTPLAQHFKLSANQMPKTDYERDQMASVPYASAVGSIMYVMVCTRPDIAYALSMVSRFMGNPGKEHWEALKWILRYLKNTINKGLVFGINKHSKDLNIISGYVDSDYAGCIDTRKSLTGYVFTMFGTAISWKANLQKVVALSTTEAEYMALTEAIKEALWLTGLIEELKLKQEIITVYCDNQSAIQLTKNSVHHERTKHIDIKLHFIREVVEKEAVKIEKIATEENPSDMITKALPSVKFEHCLKLIGVGIS